MTTTTDATENENMLLLEWFWRVPPRSSRTFRSLIPKATQNLDFSCARRARENIRK